MHLETESLEFANTKVVFTLLAKRFISNKMGSQTPREYLATILQGHKKKISKQQQSAIKMLLESDLEILTVTQHVNWTQQSSIDVQIKPFWLIEVHFGFGSDVCGQLKINLK